MVRDTVEVDAGDAGNGLQDGVHLRLFTVTTGSAERKGKSFFGGWGCRSREGHGKACDKECDRDSSLAPEGLHEMNSQPDSRFSTYKIHDAR